MDNLFVDSYYPTIENTFSKVINHKGQDYAVEIVDMAGQVSTTVEIDLKDLASQSGHLQRSTV